MVALPAAAHLGPVHDFNGVPNRQSARRAALRNRAAGWGASGDDVWIVGDRGKAIHWDGRSYAPQTLKRADLAPGEPADRLFTVSGRASNDVFAVGGNLVFHFDGTAWTPIQEPALPPLIGVSALPGEDTLVVGYEGAIRRLSSSAWFGENITEALPSGRVPDFHAVALLGGGRAFAVGGEILKLDLPRKGAIAYRSSDPLPTPVIGSCDEVRDGGADASVPDFRVTDASVPDFRVADASVPDLADAVPVDRSIPPDIAGIKANQPCPNRGGCAEGLDCYEVGLGSGILLCTHYCATPSDCGDDFGPNPQCAAPGCQYLGINRCIRHDLVGCAIDM